MLLDDSPHLFLVDFLHKISEPVNQETRMSVRIMLVNSIAIRWICLIFERLPDKWNRSKGIT